ncbi:RHS repeat-associated core domain-containing protein [Streptomyces anulatus]|uniref:RHS repeat-associated core domain-containing protein n=1 Tax=Streptomyces anulatus TaxID=1892 RepID=UPI0022582E4E|nr:RHS repeat-associated core domain-containing protein [Streptomyces anulatus]MCX4484660.1 RHS repeat-associated core domain-containing protein [Streptomyces anulatus]MCX4505330.1 RHS repeat-associated core domain-containing protein [Streptomyces anulatus]WTD09857.1 RHS repeat-associated core domain-containing protein [Streptomyces anulatus]WTE03163.1 RHS repeat-associated core domain-containing protein [Streptomyces anulatus]
MLALAVVLAVPVGLTPVAQAADGPGRPGVPKQRSSEVEAVEADGASAERRTAVRSAARNAAESGRAASERTASRWPTSAAAEVPVARSGEGRPTRVGRVPVTVERVRRAAGPATVDVRVLDRKATAAAGVRGVLLTARGDRAGTAELTVDYASFASVIGGGWAGRLSLVRLPACAVTTPEAAACQDATPLDTRNDVKGQRLTAEVSFPAGAKAQPVVLAVAADGSGQSASGAGDFSATPLASSSTWSAGGSSGSFTWSYPLDAPAPAAGPQPSLDLSYDSGSVDGRNSSTNNQGTDVGEGFGLSTVSYIDRQYGSCAKDGHDKQYDLCWKYDNASLVLNGKASELVKDDTTGKWRLSNDDASQVVHNTGADNGDDNGESWTVITGDGTKYHFGLDKLRGAGAQRTNSTWTVPVFGDDEDEPGHANGDTFAKRSLTQAWRWNLDLVEDVHGSAMTYWYTKETNHYRKNKQDKAETPYTRGGHLSRILYGQRSDTLFTATAPYRVGFGHAERCVASDCGELTESTAKNWPDVPFDAICALGEDKEECLAEGPSFFSRKRLTKITTEVPAKTGGGYDPVDSWTFTQTYLDGGDIGDSSDQTLALQSVRRTGHTGTAVTLDPVDFTYHTRPNRVEGGTQPGGGNILPLTRPRLNTVTTETGALTTVTYSAPECVRGSRMPAAEDDNAESCYPLYWNINGATNASLDWYHKYRVLAVTVGDPAGHGETVEHSYAYEKPAWRYNTSPFVPSDERTWSNWRGYQKVTALTGAATGTRTKTVSTYLQGMHKDPRDAGGTRTVTVPGIDVAGLDVPDITDAEQYAGFARQTIAYDGNTPVSVTVNDPWSARTATQHKSYADTEAYYVRTGKATTHTYLTRSRTWRSTSTATTYDSYGMAERIDSAGDLAKSGDETCTRTWYARNDAVGLSDLTSRIRVVGRPCAMSETALSLPVSSATRGDVLADTATVYDAPGATATGWTPSQEPTRGTETWTGRATGYPATATGGERTPKGWQRTARSTYDELGRQLTVTDAAGETASTVYAPTGAGVPTRATVTNAKGHRTISALDGVRGLVVQKYDANNRKTEQSYDALGRLRQVWLPDRSAGAGQSPSLTYAYTLQRGKAPAVATSTIKSSSTVSTSYEIFDSLLRPLQKQTPTPHGGRLLTDTRYDSRGLVRQTLSEIFDSKVTPNATYTRGEFGGAPKQNDLVHDGAERETSNTFAVFGIDKWTTNKSYTGDSTATSAPEGGRATRVITDALGRTAQRREYASPQPTDSEYTGTAGAPYTTTRFGYTSDGKESSITGPDNSRWTYTYDLFGRKVAATDPDKGASSTGYTSADRPDWTEDAEGRRLLYTYDELGRTTDLWSGTRTDANKLAHWTFDTLAKGQLTSSVRYDGGDVATGRAYTKAVTVYDSLYRATASQVTLDAKDPLVVSGTAQSSYAFEAAYNLDGTVQYTNEPAAAGLPAERVAMTYTSTGQTTSVSSGASGYLHGAVHDVLGRPQQLTLAVSGAAEAKKTYLNNEYEQGTGRITRAYVTTPQTAPYKPQDLTYAYDQAGNVTRITDTPNPDAVLKGETQCFGYDGHSRLKEARTSVTADCSSSTPGGPAPYRTAYTYDDGGQRRTETQYDVNGAGTTSTYCYTDTARPHALTATTGATGEKPCDAVSPAYDHDKAGNVTKRPGPTTGQSLLWDAEGRLTRLTEGTRRTDYLYDADGTLLIRRATGDGESVLHLGGTEIHLKVTGSTRKTWGTRSYKADGTVIAVRTNESGSQRLTFLAGDKHGTSSLAIDATTQAVIRRYTTPFGAARGTGPGNWPDDKRFLGKPADTGTGLTHIGARQFDALLGRFLSVDPLLESDKHQSLNGYSYAENNPVTLADPSGMGSISCSGKSCSPDWIAAEETVSPPVVGASGPGGTSGPVKSKGKNVSGNTCGPQCRAAALYEQQRLMALRQARADQIRMVMYGMQPPQARFLPRVDLTGCNKECQAELLRLHITNMPVTSGPSEKINLVRSLNDLFVEGARGVGDTVGEIPRYESDVIGELYEYSARLTGGSCVDDKADLTICTHGWLPLSARAGTTGGDTFMTKDDWSAIAPDMIRHERKHVKQWEKHGVNFIPRYLWEGADACGNKFEEQAGYADGNYQACIP